MKIIVYSEEDRLAKAVAVAIHSLATSRIKADFSHFEHVARERVWSGRLKVGPEGTEPEVRDLRIAAVSVGPDYDRLFAACGVAGWGEVIRVQTWRDGLGVKRPKRLVRVSGSAPVTVWLRDTPAFWRPTETPQLLRKLEADARRAALLIIHGLVFGEGRRPAASAPKPRETHRLPPVTLPYFVAAP
jgi:hypothetical protein